MNQHDKTHHSHDKCANRPKEETAQQHSPEVKHIEHVELLPKHGTPTHPANENQQFFDELAKLADPALDEYSEEEKELIRKATAEIPMPAWPGLAKKTASFGQLAGGGRTQQTAPALPKPAITPEEISRNNQQLVDDDLVVTGIRTNDAGEIEITSCAEVQILSDGGVRLSRIYSRPDEIKPDNSGLKPIGFDKGCGSDVTAAATMQLNGDGSVSIVGDVIITGNVTACNSETDSAGQIEHDSGGQAETDSAGQIEYDSAGQAEFDSSGESESM